MSANEEFWNAAEVAREDLFRDARHRRETPFLTTVAAMRDADIFVPLAWIEYQEETERLLMEDRIPLFMWRRAKSAMHREIPDISGKERAREVAKLARPPRQALLSDWPWAIGLLAFAAGVLVGRM